MEITVTGRQIEITDPIKQYAEDKASRLPKYYDRVSMIEVIAAKRDQLNYDLEMIAHVDGHSSFVAHGHGEDLYESIDKAFDKLERQLTDHKEKLRNRKHPANR